jgi:hypothetical protein
VTARLGWTFAVVVCLLVGAALRFVWIADAEYKDDEHQLFDTAR